MAGIFTDNCTMRWIQTLPLINRVWFLVIGTILITGYFLSGAFFSFALCPFLFRSSLIALLASLPVGVALVVTRTYRRCWSIGPVLFVAGIVGFYTSAFFIDTGNEFLDRAARRGLTSWLIQQLDSGHHGPDVVDSHGNSLLMKAAQYGHTEMVRELLKRGARTGYRDGDGDTALSVAIRYKHPECVKLLRDAGARR